jgi:[ribosomal protein S5]-alanine N-acetyltransferase
MYPVCLRGKRIVLREFDEDDAPAIFSYASQPDVARYVRWDVHPDIDTTRDVLRTWIDNAHADPRTAYEVAAVPADKALPARMIGAGRIGVTSTRHKSGDIGYVVHPDHWGEGVGSEIAILLVRFGFEQLGLHRIAATAHPDNPASQRVLEKVGMRYEGRIRHHMLTSDGWRDSLSYAILATD